MIDFARQHSAQPPRLRCGPIHADAPHLAKAAAASKPGGRRSRSQRARPATERRAVRYIDTTLVAVAPGQDVIDMLQVQSTATTTSESGCSFRGPVHRRLHGEMRQLLLLCRVQEIRAGYTSDKWFHPTIFLHNNPLRSLPQGCTSEQTQQEAQRALPRRVVKFYLYKTAVSTGM